MADGPVVQELAEETGAIVGPVVGHHPLNPDATRGEPGQRTAQKGGGAFLAFVRQNLDIGQPGRVIDGDMDEIPARAAARSLRP